MTRILALDTSTAACSVAINNSGQIEEDFVLAPQGHTKRLLPMVDGLLARHQLSLRDMDAIAYTQGPGSFTGLRICVGVVQGLAFGADLPVVPVSTLETMAASARRLLSLESQSLLVPALDARMDEIYWALFETARADASSTEASSGAIAGFETSKRLLDDRVSSVVELAAELNKRGRQARIHVLGSACPLLDPTQLASPDIQMHPECYPHALDLARLAEPLLHSGKIQSAFQASPVYVRDEVSWKKRRRIRI